MTPASSAISAELVSAYLDTDFRVLEPREFTLRIGVVSEELKAVYTDLGVSSAAYLTAWNPLSQDTGLEDNDSAQSALIRKLALRGYVTWSGLGIDPSGDWPGEESVFVPGIDLKAAKSLGREFQQNAIVWVGLDAVPQLVLLS